MLGAMELELRVAESRRLWEPGTELGSSGRTAKAFNHGVTSPSLLKCFWLQCVCVWHVRKEFSNLSGPCLLLNWNRGVYISHRFKTPRKYVL